MDIDADFWAWVYAHINDDPYDLRLRWQGKFPWIDDAIMQVECRKRTAKKLPEELSYRTFRFPTQLSAEQSTSDELARFHASLLDEGLDVLDMTAGLGIDAFHIARKAKSVIAVDRGEREALALAENAIVLGLSDKVKAICADSCAYINEPGLAFDAVFIDPARRGDNGERIYSLSGCSPDVTKLLPKIMSVSAKLIVKASPMLDISQALRDLPGISALYVVGTTTECKEIVAVVGKELVSDVGVGISVWTPKYSFTFTLEEERSSVARISNPEVGDYLYEPSEVTMKAAPWRTLSARFDLGMLHPNSHLYCSDVLVDGFPGDRWHIESIIPYSSSEIKRISRQYPKINVAVRNFGISADKLRAKLRVKDGGELRLIGTTLSDGSKVMLVLTRCPDV